MHEFLTVLVIAVPAAQYALAMRLSNIISCVVLLAAGYQWGRCPSGSPWKTGLVLVAIPLGG